MQDEIPTRSGRLIRRYREAAGITVDELAKRMGVSRACVAFVELGYRLPSSEELVRNLARGCGVSPDDLLAALAEDRADAWLKHAPPHFTEDRIQRIREIALDEEQEPVAA